MTTDNSASGAAGGSAAPPASGPASDLAPDLAEDLAYVRALAEEGRDAPLVGGLFYAIWGGLCALAAFTVYLDGVGAIDLGGFAGWAPWVGAMTLGWAASLAIGRRAHRKPGAATVGNRMAFSVWFAVGVFLTAFWFTLMAVHDNYVDAGLKPYFIFGLMFPVAFGLYGVAFYATAVAARLSWLKIVAVAALAFSMASLFFLSSVHQYLVAAAGSFFCAFLPGVILMRREPSEIV
ncbi:MAG: hypothetical protein ACE5FO_13820 [Parvularculaceae bacterium]